MNCVWEVGKKIISVSLKSTFETEIIYKMHILLKCILPGLLLFPAQFYFFQLFKYVIVQNFNVRSLHAGRTRFDDSRTLELAQRIDDDRSCDSHPVCDLAGYKNTFLAVKFIENMNDRFEFGEG